MKLALLIGLCLSLQAANKEVDPLDFDDHSNAIFSLQIQMAKLQATEDANQWWLKSLGAGIGGLAIAAGKLFANSKEK